MHLASFLYAQKKSTTGHNSYNGSAVRDGCQWAARRKHPVSILIWHYSGSAQLPAVLVRWLTSSTPGRDSAKPMRASLALAASGVVCHCFRLRRYDFFLYYTRNQVVICDGALKILRLLCGYLAAVLRRNNLQPLENQWFKYINSNYFRLFYKNFFF